MGVDSSLRTLLGLRLNLGGSTDTTLNMDDDGDYNPGWRLTVHEQQQT